MNIVKNVPLKQAVSKCLFCIYGTESRTHMLSIVKGIGNRNTTRLLPWITFDSKMKSNCSWPINIFKNIFFSAFLFLSLQVSYSSCVFLPLPVKIARSHRQNKFFSHVSLENRKMQSIERYEREWNKGGKRVWHCEGTMNTWVSVCAFVIISKPCKKYQVCISRVSFK